MNAEQIQNLKAKKRGGMYWEGDVPYLAVTEILNIIDKPQLRYWFGKKVYEAMVVDPTLSEKDALASPYKHSKLAAERGSTVHSIVEAWKNNKLVPSDSIPEQYRGYAKAFYTAIEHLKISIIHQEKSVFSKVYKYAGTLDLIIRVNNSKGIFIGDIKTGKDIYESAFLQTSAYANAITEEGKGNIEVEGICVLLLNEDATYKWEVKTDWRSKFERFKAALTLYQTINEERLKNMGYIK